MINQHKLTSTEASCCWIFGKQLKQAVFSCTEVHWKLKISHIQLATTFLCFLHKSHTETDHISKLFKGLCLKPRTWLSRRLFVRYYWDCCTYYNKTNCISPNQDFLPKAPVSVLTGGWRDSATLQTACGWRPESQTSSSWMSSGRSVCWWPDSRSAEMTKSQQSICVCVSTRTRVIIRDNNNKVPSFIKFLLLL